MGGRAATALTLALGAGLPACGGGAHPAAAQGAAPWSSVPLTPEWTDVARPVAGDHSAECEAVYRALEAEQGCKGSLCEHGASLAREWLLRCEEVSRGRTTAVTALADTFERRAAQAPTVCGRRATSILRDQCSEPAACRPLVERWAASCAASEATPLVLRKLERAVERAEGAPGFTIDARSCSDLFAEVVRVARCESRRQCEDALQPVEAFAARCLVASEPVSWPVAISLLSVEAGAGRQPPAIPLSPADAERGPDGPLALGEERGVLLRVCGEPVTTGKQVVQARRDCREGELTYARVFEGPGGPVVRVGALRFDDDASFSRRFPSIHVAAEEDARAELALPDLQRELEAAASQVKRGAAYEAWRTLARALVVHGDVLEHPRVSAALSRRDEELAPALRELGRAKVAAARRAGPGVDLAAFAQRAHASVLADVREEGIVEIGARGAPPVDLAPSMPRSVAAYRDAVSDMGAVLEQAHVREMDPEAAASAAREEIARCGAAAAQAKAAEEQLVRCAFGLDACEAEKVAARTAELDRAREALRLAALRVDSLVAGPAQGAAASIGAAQRAAGCTQD
jgi:hypothetical protein